MKNPTLDERAADLQAKYRAIQARVRYNIRRRVAAGEKIPLDEIKSAARTLGIARAQWERMEGYAADRRAKEADRA